MMSYPLLRAANPALCTGACLLLLAGCKPAPPPPAQRADYSQTLNKYYEGRPMCLWQQAVKFPVQAAAPDQAQELGLDELAASGLLVVRPAGKNLKTYDLSPEGHSAFNPDVFNPGAGNFCYGRHTIVSIDGARRNSSTTELVDYHYAIAQPAAWAFEAPIQEAFPHVPSELAGTHVAQATLLDTTDGWEVSGTPANITPIPPRPHTSALAKAKGLLRMKAARLREETALVTAR